MLKLSIQGDAWRSATAAASRCPPLATLSLPNPQSAPVNGRQLPQALWRSGIWPGGQHIAQRSTRLCCPLPRSTQGVEVLHVKDTQRRGCQLPYPKAAGGAGQGRNVFGGVSVT